MSSGFPIIAALILMGLILIITIWDIVKARKINSQAKEDEDEFESVYDEFFGEPEKEKSDKQ